MTKLDLLTTEYDQYFLRYIDKLSSHTELRKGFETGKDLIVSFFRAIPQEKLEYRYQPDKWSVKDILQHIIDTERIFIYRCFRIARRDKTALAGYDQNIYIEPSQANDKSLDELLIEFILTRNYSISILNSLTEEDLCFVGNANGSVMSARAAAFTIIGHEIWHVDVIKDKYL